MYIYNMKKYNLYVTGKVMPECFYILWIFNIISFILKLTDCHFLDILEETKM